MKQSKIFFGIFCLSFVFLNAQENALDFIVKTADSMNSYQQYKISETEILTYKKPKIWDAVNKIIPNAKGTIKDIVSKKYYPYGLASLGATLVFIPMDPWFISESRNFGESLGLNEDHNYKKLGILKIIPADIGAAMYFIGNGTVVILISAGFGTYGLLKNDFRAQSTSLQLLESIAQSGLFAQSIKRITGRESPFITDRAGREHSYWQFMPSFSAYQKHTSNYDAMPSGHLTTAVAALTVITENYPEKVWIKPVGYTLLGLMCFEMLQSKVHWVSDYPIAIFLGYLIGKNISKSRIIKAQNSENTHNISKINFKISASKWNEYQTLGINISF